MNNVADKFTKETKVRQFSKMFQFHLSQVKSLNQNYKLLYDKVAWGKCERSDCFLLGPYFDIGPVSVKMVISRVFFGHESRQNHKKKVGAGAI